METKSRNYWLIMAFACALLLSGCAGHVTETSQVNNTDKRLPVADNQSATANTESDSDSDSGSDSIGQSSDYRNELKYPDIVNVLQLVDIEEYENPMYGVSLQYAHTVYTDDIVTLYVYPIPAIYLDDQDLLLDHEINNVVAGIEQAQAQGAYSEVDVKDVGSIQFDELNGRKATVDMVRSNGMAYRSLAYVFMQKDKYIKVRYSLLKDDESAFPNPDNIVSDLVSRIQVPEESAYMKALRKQEEERQAVDMILKKALQ